MTRSAFPWTSPTRRFTCASAIRRDSTICYRPEGWRLLFHGSAASPLSRAALSALSRGAYRPAPFGPDGRRSRRRHPPRRAPNRRPSRRCHNGHRGATRAPPAAPEQLAHGGAELGGRLHRAHSRRLESGVLVGCRALAARHDRPGMPHALAGRRSEPGDIRHHGLAGELSDVAGGRLLVAAPDLADEDDAP